MRPLTLALLLLATTTPAFAQDVPAQDVPHDCTSAFEVFGLFNLDEATVKDTENGCLVHDLKLNIGSYVVYRIGEVEIIAPGLFEAIANETLPPQASITARNVFAGPDMDDPLFNYITEIQSTMLDAHLSYSLNATSGLVNLEELSVKVAGGEGISLSGSFSGFSTEEIEAIVEGGMPNAALHQITLRVDNPQLFTSMVAVPLIGQMPANVDPRPMIASLQQMASGMIYAVPAFAMDDASKATANRFIEQFPKLQDKYILEASTPRGADLMAFDLSYYQTLLSTEGELKISARHEPLN